MKTIKEKVLRKNNKLSSRQTKRGQWYIVDSDGNDILSEFLLPWGETEDDAWSQALLTLRTKQQIDRTHPERGDFEHDEKKHNRISERKLTIDKRRRRRRSL
jgi:hypothetical protein